MASACTIASGYRTGLIAHITALHALYCARTAGFGQRLGSVVARGLAAARHLYEAHGLQCVQERSGTQWGTEVLEQHFVRERPSQTSA